MKEIQAPQGKRLAAVLETVDGRAISVRLGAGEELGDHQIRERAWLMAVEGTARIEAGGDVVDAGPGTLLTLKPGERHSVASDGGARIVMISPPGRPKATIRLGLATMFPRPEERGRLPRALRCRS